MIRRDIEVLPRRCQKAAATGAARGAAAAAALFAALLAALLAALAGCSAGVHPGTQGPAAMTTARPALSHATPPQAAAPAPMATPPRTPTPAQARTATRTPAKPSALPVAPPDAGAEPQTATQPQTSSLAFRNAIHDIWLAVTTGNPDYALPAFFPEKAYEQVKAIAAPDFDWKDRLWLDFTLDLAAVHQLVKPAARLSSVIMPAQYYQWIPPGACYNNDGYWHAPGARVVYEEGGVTHSFGIASFISWRGDWYLIHLGAVVRDGAYGIVDDPEPGTGVPGPPGNC
jgi:hypothetical protein